MDCFLLPAACFVFMWIPSFCGYPLVSNIAPAIEDGRRFIGGGRFRIIDTTYGNAAALGTLLGGKVFHGDGPFFGGGFGFHMDS